MDMGSLTCAVILARAVYKKAKQAPTRRVFMIRVLDLDTIRLSFYQRDGGMGSGGTGVLKLVGSADCPDVMTRPWITDSFLTELIQVTSCSNYKKKFLNC